MFKKFNMFALTLLILGQTILGPIGISTVAFAEEPEPISETEAGEPETQAVSEQSDDETDETTGDDPGDAEDPSETEEIDDENNEGDTDQENDNDSSTDGNNEGSSADEDEGEVESDSDSSEENNEALQAATDAVEAAEAAGKDLTEEQYNQAVALVEALEEGAEKEALKERIGDLELPRVMAAGPYDDMVLGQGGVELVDTSFLVNSNPVTLSTTVKNGDEASFNFKLKDIPANHNYGLGTTLEVEIPDVFGSVSGQGDLTSGGETVGSYSTSSGSNIVTLTFNENIRQTVGEQDLPLPIEGVTFNIQAEFAYTSNDLNTTVDIPGGETISLTFTPEKGKPIHKEGVGDISQSNVDSLEWKVIVNTDLNSAEEFVDTLENGHKFKTTENPVVKEITLGTTGGPEDYVPGTSVTPSVSYDGDTVMKINGLAANKAYEITYKTYLEDPGNETQVQYRNAATYGQGNSDDDFIVVNYDPPLKKEGDMSSDLTTEWTIKVNHNKRTLESITVEDSWTTSGGSGEQKQEILGDIVVKDSNDTDVTSQFVVNHDAAAQQQGLSIEFGDISDAYTITYKTKPTEGTYITSNMTVKNDVTRSDDPATFKDGVSVTYNKTSFMLEKTAEGVDNSTDKKMSWKIVECQH